MSKPTSKNIYDLILITTIVLLVFGGIGGAFQPVRLFSLAVGFLIIAKNSAVVLKREILGIVVFFIFLFSYSLISLSWTIDLTEGMKASFYLVCHITIFFNIVICFHRANNPLDSLLLGWLLFVGITIPIALFELIFDQHLSTSFYESNRVSYTADGTAYFRRFASVTFGNFNTYVVVLVCSLPFLFGLLLRPASKVKMGFYVFVLFIVYAIILINASRGGIVCGIVIFLMFSFLRKGRKFKVSGFLRFLFVCAVFVFIYYAPLILEQIMLRLSGDRGLFQDQIREKLFEAAYDISRDYNFMGAGAGSLETLMILKKASIHLPHNFLLEILAQYGIVFLSIFVFFILKLLYKAYNSDIVIFRVIVLCAVSSMPLLFIVNSGYLYYPVIWVYFSSLYMLSFVRLFK